MRLDGGSRLGGRNVSCELRGMIAVLGDCMSATMVYRDHETDLVRIVAS